MYAKSVKTNSMELQTPKGLELFFSPEAVLTFEMLLHMATFMVLCYANVDFFANQETIVKDAKYRHK